MSEQLLYLFYGHPFVDGRRCQRSPEFVRMNLWNAEGLPQCPQHGFHPADGQSAMWGTEPDKQGGVGILAGIEIVQQVDFGSGIEIDDPFLVALAEYDAFPFLEIDVLPVQQHQFAHAHACRGQHVDNCQIAEISAAVPHALQSLVGIGILDHLSRLDFVNPSRRAFQNVILVLQPREEAAQDAPDVVDGHPARAALLLIIRQVAAQIVRRDLLRGLADPVQHVLHRLTIVGQRLFRAALHLLCREKSVQRQDRVFRRRSLLRDRQVEQLMLKRFLQPCCLNVVQVRHHLR